MARKNMEDNSFNVSVQQDENTTDVTEMIDTKLDETEEALDLRKSDAKSTVETNNFTDKSDTSSSNISFVIQTSSGSVTGIPTPEGSVCKTSIVGRNQSALHRGHAADPLRIESSIPVHRESLAALKSATPSGRVYGSDCSSQPATTTTGNLSSSTNRSLLTESTRLAENTSLENSSPMAPPRPPPAKISHDASPTSDNWGTVSKKSFGSRRLLDESNSSPLCPIPPSPVTTVQPALVFQIVTPIVEPKPSSPSKLSPPISSICANNQTLLQHLKRPICISQNKRRASENQPVYVAAGLENQFSRIAETMDPHPAYSAGNAVVDGDESRCKKSRTDKGGTKGRKRKEDVGMKREASGNKVMATAKRKHQSKTGSSRFSEHSRTNCNTIDTGWAAERDVVKESWGAEKKLSFASAKPTAVSVMSVRNSAEKKETSPATGAKEANILCGNKNDSLGSSRKSDSTSVGRLDLSSVNKSIEKTSPLQMKTNISKPAVVQDVSSCEKERKTSQKVSDRERKKQQSTKTRKGESAPGGGVTVPELSSVSTGRAASRSVFDLPDSRSSSPLPVKATKPKMSAATVDTFAKTVRCAGGGTGTTDRSDSTGGVLSVSPAVTVVSPLQLMTVSPRQTTPSAVCYEITFIFCKLFKFATFCFLRISVLFYFYRLTADRQDYCFTKDFFLFFLFYYSSAINHVPCCFCAHISSWSFYALVSQI